MNPQDTNQDAQAPVTTPEQPVAPAPVPSAAPAPVKGNGPDKKLIKMIAIIGGAVLLLAIAAVVLVSMMSVSKEDFKKAYDNASDLRDTYSDMTVSTYLGSSATETERDNALDELKEGKAKFDEQFKELEGQKAIQRDGEASKLFKALKDQKVKFDAAITSTTEAYESIILPISEINSVSASRDTTGIQKAIEALKASQGDLKDENNKKFVADFIPLLEKYKAAAERYQEAIKDFSKYNSSVSSEYSSAARAVSTAIRDWSSDFRKQTQDAEIKDQFNDLGEYLAEKASGK